MKNASARMNLATMIAATMGALGPAALGMLGGQSSEPKPRKRVPTMVTASLEEIAAWNAKVTSDRLDRIANRRRDHRMARAFADTGQRPKFPKARVHKQHKHPLRDDHGAFCLTGKPYSLEGVHPTSREVVLTGWVDGEQFGNTVQRKWLAGISAQRGY
jgi:hypothetical protein